MGNAKDVVLVVLFERRDMLSEFCNDPVNVNRPEDVPAAEKLELPISATPSVFSWDNDDDDNKGFSIGLAPLSQMFSASEGCSTLDMLVLLPSFFVLSAPTSISSLGSTALLVLQFPSLPDDREFAGFASLMCS